MNKILLVLVTNLIVGLSFAQVSDSISNNWKLQATYGLNGTQSSFVNWAAGGRNNISVLGYIEAAAK